MSEPDEGFGAGHGVGVDSTRVVPTKEWMARLEDIFSAALECPPAERKALIAEACRGDAELEQRVWDLVQAHDRAGEMFESGLDPVEIELARLKPEEVGDQIGPYRLLEQIGEGGFGVVWKAEQERPVKRVVALKIIKLGMDTKEVMARFGQERQALAVMDHPSVAKVFDAGATQFGRPFFAMELVQGARITDYCDQCGMTVNGRLELFIAVCQAVQHAHQKGIIHRDLKPSNVLVTVQDGKPVPKVIDFGVAKAIGERLTDQTIRTEIEQPIGTPVYMSPEQVGMNGMNVDTRTDVYALGVLLYEVLTGRTPFERAVLMERGFEGMRRIIQEVEPPKPSGAMRAMEREQLEKVAGLRRIGPEKLIHAISGDLDWIVMKAIEKDRTRRYGTANGLGADIQRYLADEPVSAGPPSAGYKFRKFARRNKTALAVGATILAILLAGVTTSTILYFRVSGALTRESDQRQRAERSEKLAEQKAAAESVARTQAEAARVEAEAMTAYIINVFASAQRMRRGPDVTVIESLSEALRQLQTELANYPEQKHKLQLSIASVMHTIAEPRRFVSYAEESRDYYLANRPPEHLDLLKAEHAVGIYYMELKRWKEAKEILERIYPIEERTLPLGHPEYGELTQTMGNLAACYSALGQKVEALTLREKAYVACQARNLGEDHVALVKAKEGLAASYHDAGRFDDALKLRQEIVASLKRTFRPYNALPYIKALEDVAATLGAVKQFEEALKYRVEVLAYQKENFKGFYPKPYINALESTARTLDALNRPEEAASLRALAEKIPRNHDIRILATSESDYKASVGQVARTLGMRVLGIRRFDQAIKKTREMVEMHPELLPPPSGEAEPEVWLANALLLKAGWEGEQTPESATEAACEAQEILQRLAARKRTLGTTAARVDILMSYGHWKEATILGRSLYEEFRGNPWPAFRYGPLLVKTGDIQAYERLCDEILRPYASAKPAELKQLFASYHGHASDIIARVVCLRPPTPENLKWAVALAEEAMKQKESPYHMMFIVARALAAYREGDFAKAVALLEPVLPRMHSVTAVDANAILAMAKYRLGDSGAARRALEKGEGVFKLVWLSKERIAIAESVQDWLMADILLREAKELMVGNK